MRNLEEMNYLTEEMVDAQVEILEEVLRQTQQGLIKWKCVDYNPISFLNKDRLDERNACVSHIFAFVPENEGSPFELEIAEIITIPDGKGDISVSFTRNASEDFFKLDMMLSGLIDPFDDTPVEKLGEQFKDSIPVLLSEALIPAAVSSESVEEVFEWARFFNEKGISKKLREHPLTKLGEKLLNERRILDFHRCILDTDLRQKILSE